MNTNMMLALMLLVIVMLVTPAAALTPTPALPCDYYKFRTSCNAAFGCYWNTDDNECKSTVEAAGKAVATFVIVLIVIAVLIVIGVIACIVCCCCMGANAVRNKDTVVVQQQPLANQYQNM